MPSEPVWLKRLPCILEELRTLDSDYLDRHAIQRIFGVRERRARQLMAELSTLRVGNAVAVSRRSLIARLESSLSDGSANADSAPAFELPAAPELRPSDRLGEILLASNGMLRPGQTANPATQFKPGNSDRWQSDNPAVIARSRLQFGDSFYEGLLGERSAAQVANLLWEAVRKQEPWAFQALQRLATDAKQIEVTRMRRNGTPVKVANAPVVPAPEAADASEDSRATDRPVTPAAERPSSLWRNPRNFDGAVSRRDGGSQRRLGCVKVLRRSDRFLRLGPAALVRPATI